MNGERTIALLGLPRTGKSTYLGALWLLVQDPTFPDVWEKDVTGDRSHIQRLADLVGAGEEIPRTNVDSDQRMSLELGFQGRGSVRLDIPDLSGEAVRQVVEERVWHRALGETVVRSDALMIFLNPSQIAYPMPVVRIGSSGKGEPEQGGEEPRFVPEKACTSAKLVDFLENVADLRSDSWPLPVAVVVSAWDAVMAGLTPSQWLEKRVLGVASYLSANKDVVTASIFGVSAQGGELPKDKEQLLAKGDVSHRVFAVDSEGDSATLLSPVSSVVWPE